MGFVGPALECWYSCSPRYCAHVLSIRFLDQVLKSAHRHGHHAATPLLNVRLSDKPRGERALDQATLPLARQAFAGTSRLGLRVPSGGNKLIKPVLSTNTLGASVLVSNKK